MGLLHEIGWLDIVDPYFSCVVNLLCVDEGTGFRSPIAQFPSFDSHPALFGVEHPVLKTVLGTQRSTRPRAQTLTTFLAPSAFRAHCANVAFFYLPAKLISYTLRLIT